MTCTPMASPRCLVRLVILRFFCFIVDSLVLIFLYLENIYTQHIDKNLDILPLYKNKCIYKSHKNMNGCIISIFSPLVCLLLQISL